jgi:serine/threonine-protein kinase RsbT
MRDEEDTAPLILLRGKNAADRFGCALAVRMFALRVGLSARAAEELALAASELASNVVRHADSGSLELRRVASPRAHVLMICRDRGPGIRDPKAALKDGYSGGRMLPPDAPRHHGLGRGLGAIERLVDELCIESTLDVGTTVTARKWIP